MTTKFDCQVVNGLSKVICGRVDLLEKLLGYKVRENLKYSDIQKIVKSGFAKEFFDLGDEIMTTYTATDGTEYDFPWRIVDFRDVYWENDPAPHPGMVLQAKYATAETLPYDPAETNYGNGCPYWPHSTVRQWLNSDAEVGNWWTEQHEGDTAPNELNTYNGFMYGLEADFLDVIKPTKVFSIAIADFDPEAIDNTSISYDKFFIASDCEMYGAIPGGSWNPSFAKYFEYWVKTIGTDAPTSSANDNRIFKSINDVTSNRVVASRTYNRTYVLGILYIMHTGSTNSLIACAVPTNVLPCCVIS